VLLLSAEPPHSGTAGGVVMQRWLEGYPADRLLVVSNLRVPSGCTRLPCRYVHLPLGADRLQRTRLWSWRNRLSVLAAARGAPVGAVQRGLGDFQPQVVMTVMQDSWMYALAARYAQEAGLPLLLTVHDLPQIFEPLSGWWQRRQRARDAAICRQAAARRFISQPMQDWFQRGYGVDGDVLPPPRSDHAPQRDPAASRELHVPGKLSLGYAGGLHYGYGEQLLRLVPDLRATGSHLHLFSPEPSGLVRSLRSVPDVITWHGRETTPEAASRRLISVADVVLQPYLDPPGTHALQYQTHFPSKLGDLLTLGLPLLVTGPADAAGVTWCRARPGSAVVVETGGAHRMSDLLRRLREDGAWRVRLAEIAQRVAAEFEPAPIRQRLWSGLRQLAAAPCH
jgi:hypothetical protein